MVRNCIALTTLTFPLKTCQPRLFPISPVFLFPFDHHYIIDLKTCVSDCICLSLTKYSCHHIFHALYLHRLRICIAFTNHFFPLLANHPMVWHLFQKSCYLVLIPQTVRKIVEINFYNEKNLFRFTVC